MTNAPTTRETADHAELAACPFCGSTATIERFGNTRVSTQYQCDDCGCFLETGEEFHHGRAWNRRPREEALLSEIAALRGDLTVSRDDLDQLQAHFRQRDREATQAERQRDELRKALEPFGPIMDAIDEPAPKPLPEQTSRVAEAMAGKADDAARRQWEGRVYAAKNDLVFQVRQALANQGADQ